MRTLPYRGRDHAGRVLADLLRPGMTRPCVIAGIPRGGVLVADAIARRLRCPLTLSFTGKLAPLESPDWVIGAVDEDDQVVVDDRAGDPDVLTHARGAVTQELRRERQAFPVTPIATFLPEFTVVLVDDGLATAYSLRAAIAHARRHGARRVVAAVPCASAGAAAEIQRVADELVCPWVDEAFAPVGSYYRTFRPVTDQLILAAIENARPRSAGHTSPPPPGRWDGDSASPVEADGRMTA